MGGVLDGNRGLVVVDEGKDVDGLILAGAEGGGQKVPEGVGKAVLFGNETESLGHTVVDDAILHDVGAVAGKGLEAGKQVVDQLVERDLDSAVCGLEG